MLKIGLMINVACWGVYGWFVQLYPVMVFNAVAFVFAAISTTRIFLSLRHQKAQLPPTTEEEPHTASPTSQTDPDSSSISK